MTSLHVSRLIAKIAERTEQMNGCIYRLLLQSSLRSSDCRAFKANTVGGNALIKTTQHELPLRKAKIPCA